MPVRVVIRNFQSLESAEMEVSGFTALCGPNNAGKSAVARALRGVFSNTPSEALVRRGAQEMRVEVDFGGGARLAWGRADKRPYYQVGELAPVYPGRDVPPEVGVLGVRSIQVGADTCWPNFARQFDAPFMAEKSGPALAEVVSCPERVALLAQALKCLESDLRQVRAQVAAQDAEEQRSGQQFLKLAERARAAEVASRLRDSFRGLVDLAQHVSRARQMQLRLRSVDAQVRRARSLASIPVPPGSGAVRALLSRLHEVRAATAKLQRAEIAARHASVTAQLPLPRRGVVADLLGHRARLDQLRGRSRAAELSLAQARRSVELAAAEQAQAQEARAELLNGSPLCTLCQRPL